MVDVRDARLVGGHTGGQGQVQTTSGQVVADRFKCDYRRTKGQTNHRSHRPTQLSTHQLDLPYGVQVHLPSAPLARYWRRGT